MSPFVVIGIGMLASAVLGACLYAIVVLADNERVWRKHRDDLNASIEARKVRS